MLLNILLISLIQLFFIFILNKFAYSLNLLDYPSIRKKHLDATPFIGGIAITFTYCFIIFINQTNIYNLNIIILCSLLLSLIGLIDDKFDINPISKLFLQSLPVYILINNNIYLQDIGYYENFGFFELGAYGKYFTFLSCLLIMNAFNYSDGVDGLLSTLFLNIFFSFIVLCILFNEKEMIEYFIYLIIPIAIFLLFNFSTFNLPKVFLGDSGSLALGFITGFTMIVLYNENKIHASILVWPVAFIVYEFLSTNLLRFYKKKNLFQSGTDHIHYQISKKFKLKTLGINFYLNLLNLFITVVGFTIYFIFGSFYSLMCFVFIFLIYLGVKYKLILN